MLKEVKKILLIRYSAIGDVVLASAIIELLKKRFPESSLSMLVTPTTAPIVEKNPFLDRIILYQKNKPFAYLKCARLLKKERFDLIISLQWKASLLTFLAGARKRVGFHKSFRYRYFYNLRPKRWYPERHALNRYLNTIEPLGIKGEIPEPKIYLSREEEETAEKLLQEKFGPITLSSIPSPRGRGSQGRGDFLVGFNPVAGYPAKEWPLEYYIRLGKRLIERYNAKIIIFGEGKQRNLNICRKLQDSLGGNSISLAGRTNLRQLAALSKACRLFITGDTGPMHIAVAVGTKVIAFFGSTDPGKCSPIGKGHITLEDKSLSCLHCYKRRCRRTDCMKNITPEKVWEEIDENSGFRLREQ